MANYHRKRSRKWRFSDGGNRFDGTRQQDRRRRQQRVARPISPAFRRGVRHCKRCHNRVVSNVDYCPFCGKNLLPVIQRLWFWLIVVLLVGVSVFAIVYYTAPSPQTDKPVPDKTATPTVVNAPPNTPIKDLAVGTTVDVSGLQATVTSFEEGPLGRSGQPLMVLSIDFVNTSNAPVTLYSTQWMVQLADGTRVDTYLGSTVDGVTVTGNFEASPLPANGSFTGRLYFDTSTATEIVFQPTPFTYDESLLVTWKIS